MITRRRFLVLSAAAATAACGSASEDTAADASRGDTGAGDASARDGSEAGDLRAEDAERGDEAGAEAGAEDTGPRPVFAPVKGPWGMVAGAAAVRVRFETVAGVAPLVTLVTPDGARVAGEPTASTATIEMAWPIPGLTSAHPDEPGAYTLHDVLFVDLTPGARYTFELESEATSPRVASFRAPAAPDQTFRAVWVADTMFPYSEGPARLAAEAGADVFLHGGDIQYFSNPLDTWNGYFAFFGPVLERTVAHHAIGNHEYESFGEYDSHFVRLFGGQGDPTGTVEYFAFTYGGVRFVFLNSEVDFGAVGGPQTRWCDDTLSAAAGDPSIHGIVVAFHRPFFTFGKSSPSLAVRGTLHPMFVRHGVKLVLTGHNHGYERFVVDGITYVVDGGGGAVLTDIDEALAEIAAERPEEPALRLVKSRTYGALTLDFGPGTISARRGDVEGNTVDTFELT